MAEPDSVDEARALLRQSRQRLLGQRADIDSELSRIDAALEALTPVGTPGVPKVPRAPDAQPSVRTMLLTLLGEENRDWNAQEVVDEYERRGSPVHGKDPLNSVRAAIVDAEKRGLILRTTRGRYKSTKWSSAVEAVGALLTTWQRPKRT